MNEAAFAIDFPFHVFLSPTFCGRGGLGGISDSEPGSVRAMFEEEKYMEKALLVMDVRDARASFATDSLYLRSWSLSLLQ